MELISRLMQQKKALLVVAGLAVFVAALSWFLFYMHPQPKVTIQKLPFTSSENFPLIKGDDIYAYNGLAFYKTNLYDQGEVKVLSSGTKLPSIRELFWADEVGAFLVFDDSAYVRSLTESVLSAQGKSVDKFTREYLWYFRFSDSSLHPVDTTPPTSNTSGFYSSSKNGFYYLPEVDHEEGGEGQYPPLRFFSTKTLENSELENTIRMQSANYMGPCVDSYIFCAIGDQGGSSVLVGYAEDGKSNTLLRTPGFIAGTNMANKFLKITPTKGGGSEDSFVLMGTSLFDAKTGKTVASDIKTYSRAVVVSEQSDGSLYALSTGSDSPERSTTLLSGGKTILGPTRTSGAELSVPKGESSSGSIVGNIMYGKNGVAAFSDENDVTYLLSSSSTTPHITVQQPSVIKKAVDACTKAYGVENSYYDDSKLFKVYFSDDQAFTTHIKQFSDCLLKSSGAVVGYHYYFGGISPKNGRYTTD